MEDRRDPADIPRSALSDLNSSGSGFKLSDKLRARMEKLEKWRIRSSSIKSPEGAREFHGGHATVSKAFLLDSIGYRWFWGKYYNSSEVMQLCRQSSESDDIRGATYQRRDDEGELGDEEKDNKQEHKSDSDELWWGKFVAVKKSRTGDNTNLERTLGLALRETEFLVELSHPNVVELEGFVEDLSKDIIWLVFPWAQNGNLKDFVASRDWAIPERISLINDVAVGLEYLHSRQPPICHGDLKSFNVLVNSEHVAMITDFGSARHLTEPDPNRQPGLVQNQQQSVQAKFSTLTKTITLTGNIYTLRWAAPELLNDDQISRWSDIWALGWIGYEVLTNSIPFQDVPADAAVIERVINGDLPSIDEHARVAFFQNLCSLMTRCWNSNPSERPTAKDYLHAPRVVPGIFHMTDPTSPNTYDSRVLMQWGGRGRKSSDTEMASNCFTGADQIYTRIGDRGGKADALHCLAELRLVRSEYNDAIKLYSEVLQIRTDTGDRAGRASALWGLAEVHRFRSEYTEAIKLYSEVLQIRNDIGDRRGQVDALSSLAQVHLLRKEYSEATKLYSEALKSCTNTGDMAGRASALWGLAEVHRFRNEYTKAIALYSEDLQIRNDIGDKRGRASALSGLAKVHRLRKEYSEAIKLYSEVLQISNDIGDRRGRVDALSSLAQVHLLRKEYSKATKLNSEALQIRNDIGDRRGRVDALSSLAQVHLLRNEYSEAIKLYSEALQIYTDIGDQPGQTCTLSSLFEVHRLRKQYSEALKIRPDVDNNLRKASALSILAKVHRVRDEYPEAFALYSEVLQIFSDTGDRQGRAFALSSLAQVRLLQNEYSEAIKLYSEALQIRPDVDDTLRKASALSSLAQVHLPRNEYSESIKLYSEALQIYTNIRNEIGQACTLSGLFEVHRLRKQYSEALKIRPDVDNASALSSLARVHRLRGEYTEAVALYSEVLQIRNDIGDRRGRVDALSSLAKAHLLRIKHSDSVKLYSEILLNLYEFDDNLARINRTPGSLRGLGQAFRRAWRPDSLLLAPIANYHNQQNSKILDFSPFPPLCAGITQTHQEALQALSRRHRAKIRQAKTEKKEAPSTWTTTNGKRPI